MTRLGGLGAPGVGALLETVEKELLWGGDTGKLIAIYKNGVVDGASRDSGNTPTTILRPGLVLGKLTSGGQYTEYDPAATDGSEVAEAILPIEIRAQDFDSTDADRHLLLLVGGNVKAAQLIGLDVIARAQLGRQFIFDDDLGGNTNPTTLVVAKTADYTVLAADNNKLFTTQGAGGTVNFTLPAIDRGLRFRFFSEAAGAMTVTAGTADTLVAFNDLAADSIAFATAVEIIGGAVEVIANADETKWLVFVNLGAETQTPTIAT